MTVVTGTRPRVLIVESDEGWRQRLRDHLGSVLGTCEASSVEEALGWLEGRAPGLTVLCVASGDPLAEASVARLCELYPLEIVVLATEEPTVELCRSVMRVGAFDVLPRAACFGSGFDRTLAAAGEKLALAQSRRRRSYERVREAVARHERHATAQLLENHAVSGAWSRLAPDLRRRWIRRYLNAAVADAAERAVFVREMVEEILDVDQPAAVTIALHVQSVTAVQANPGSEAPPESRNLCVELLAAVVDRLQRGLDDAERKGEPQALWHRWRLGGDEYWWLVIDGRLRAQVCVRATGVEGHWLTEPSGTQVRTSALPGLPEALREIERRVGCRYVLDVAPAEDI